MLASPMLAGGERQGKGRGKITFKERDENF
jgi:hypothetical protein